jgi:hypothetical protein
LAQSLHRLRLYKPKSSARLCTKLARAKAYVSQGLQRATAESLKAAHFLLRRSRRLTRWRLHLLNLGLNFLWGH